MSLLQPCPVLSHHHHFSPCSFSLLCARDTGSGSFSPDLVQFPFWPCAVMIFFLLKDIHWVIATSNFSTAWLHYGRTEGRRASESGVWCHLLDIWHFHSKPAWPFLPSWLLVGFPVGFVSPLSLQVFLLNGAPESTQKGVQLYSLWVSKGSRSGGSIDAVPLDYSHPSLRYNTAVLWVVQLFSPPFEIHLQRWTLPFPQCWLLKLLCPLKKNKNPTTVFLFILSFFRR